MDFRCNIEHQQTNNGISYYSLQIEHKECLTDVIMGLFNEIPKCMLCNWTYESADVEGNTRHCVDFGLVTSGDGGADLKERLDRARVIATNIIDLYDKRKNLNKLQFIKGKENDSTET